MTQTDIQEFHSMCREVVAHCPDPYAKSYADAGLRLTDPDYVRVQCLCILSNMGSWRGPTAAGPRRTFKRLGKRRS